MQSIPRLLKAIPYAVLFVLLLGFAIKNTVPVAVRYYLGAEWQAPLVVVLLVTFALGAAAGVLASLSYLMRQRRELARLRRKAQGTPASDGDGAA